jgi:mono/diheme cytochrome c family protein
MAMKASKKATMVVAVSALLAASAWTIGAFADDRQGDSATAAQVSGADAQLVERGRYLATVADCAACHTAKNGKPFAGGLGIESPIGRIYSTNITPDKNSGIGKYSYDDFDRAVRHGIARDGSTLYPAMPYASYAKVKPSDMQALYAYFMHGVQPIERANKATDIPWPLSMRWPLRFWRMAFAPEVATDDLPVSNDPVARAAIWWRGSRTAAPVTRLAAGDCRRRR